MSHSLHAVDGADVLATVLMIVLLLAMPAVLTLRRRTHDRVLRRPPAARTSGAGLTVLMTGGLFLTALAAATVALAASTFPSADTDGNVEAGAGSGPRADFAGDGFLAEADGDDDRRGGLEADTSALGSFTNSIPIDVPGFRGLEPRVSLDYDSNGGPTEVGKGWRLNAGSRVVRNGPDGSLPRYDRSDVFVLDGAELVQCTPRCVTGGTHETREQSFQRIVFDSLANTWTRWDRSGIKSVYRDPAGGAATPYEWVLDSVEDPHGNKVRYLYDCASGHCYLSSIQYAESVVPCGQPGQPVCKTGAVVRFWYESRPDVVSYPTGRGTRSLRSRLKSIEIRMDGQLVTAYALTYRTSRSGVSMLSTLQQFPDDALVVTDPDAGPPGTIRTGNTAPLPPMTFSSSPVGDGRWQYGKVSTDQFTITAPPGNPNYPVTNTTLPRQQQFVPGLDPQTMSGQPIMADFDGDGRVDMATVQMRGCDIDVRLATGVPVHTQLLCDPGKTPMPYLGDLDGDQDQDLLLVRDNGNLLIALSTGDGSFELKLPTIPMPWGTSKPRHCTVGDLDGDDLADVACVYQSSQGPRLGTARVTRALAFTTAETPLPAAVQAVYRWTRIAVGDVEARGRSAVMLATAPINGKWQFMYGYTESSGKVATWSPVTTHPDFGPDFSPDATGSTSLAAADVNGDRGADFVMIGQEESLSSAFVALSDEQSPSGLTIKGLVGGNVENITVGDGDGDGRADLLTGHPLGMLRSNSDGTFSQVTWSTNRSCRGGGESPGTALAYDSNGDGQDDLTCASEGTSANPPQSVFNLWTQPAPVTVAPHRWQPMDDGSGRPGLVYMHFTNPGYHVYTLHGQDDGSYRAADQPITPTATLPLNNPAANEPLLIDAGGGPQGAPDGRSDLVFLDRDSTGAAVTVTLLSTSAGWTMRAEPIKDVNGKSVSLTEAELGDWRPAMLDRSGRTGLVHFAFANPGLRVRSLVSGGDGTWTAYESTFFGAGADGGPLTRPDVQTVRSTDENMDSLVDFRHVDVDTVAIPNKVTVRSLISTGPGQWRENTKTIQEAMDPAAAHRLLDLDFNSDQVPDLGRAVLVDGCLRIEAFVRIDDTWSTKKLSGAPSGCRPSSPRDLMNVVLADIDGNGTDLYRMTRTGMYTQLNPGDPTQPWVEVAQPGLQTTPDAWAWFMFDTDHDGGTHGGVELAHPGANSLETLSWLGDDGRITGIDNGRGAVTSIDYEAQAGARQYLPVGMLPIVVKSIMLTDYAYTPASQSIATFTYDAAVWSNELRQMTGYAVINSNQGNKRIHTVNQLSDSCGAREQIVEVQDTGGRVFHRSTTAFLPAGAAAPFTCLPERVRADECELTPPLPQHHHRHQI